MPPKKDLGSILLDEDVLDAKALERASAGNPAGRRPLWAALIDAEAVTSDQIFRAMAARFGVPVVSDERLAEVQVPEVLKRALTRAEALASGLLPVDLTADGQRATVVMVNPSDERTLADFLTRARLSEGRALLARRESLMRAIERCFADATAVVTPLPPAQRRGSGPSRPPTLPPPGMAPPPLGPANLTPPHGAKPLEPKDDDITGTVKLDPSLQAEIQRLPARMSQADALTPLPRPRPKRPTPPATPPQGTSSPPPTPPASSHTANAGAEEPSKSSETPSEALRAEERLTRALVETVEVLASELEARIVGGAGRGAEMARLARRVARQLGLARRAADEIGVAAQLYALDRLIRNVEGPHSADLFAELGWSAAGDAGLLADLALAHRGVGGVRPLGSGRGPRRRCRSARASSAPSPIMKSWARPPPRRPISTPSHSCCAHRPPGRTSSTRCCASSRAIAATRRRRRRRRCRPPACCAKSRPRTTSRCSSTTMTSLPRRSRSSSAATTTRPNASPIRVKKEPKENDESCSVINHYPKR